MSAPAMIPDIWRRVAPILLVILAVWAGVVTAPVPARAQTAPASSPSSAAPLSADDAANLVKTLENPDARQKLIDQLRALAQAQHAAAPEGPVPDRVASYLLERLSDHIADGAAALFRATAFVTDGPKLYDWLRRTLGDKPTRDRLAEILAKVLLALCAGWVAEYAVVRSVRRMRAWIERRASGDGWKRAPFAVLSALIAAVPIAVFVAVAFGALTLSEPSRPTRLVTLALMNAHVLARVVLVVVGTILAPRSAAMRFVPLGDETAAYIHIWAGRITGIVVYGYFLAEAALLVGVPRPSFDLFMQLLGLVVTLLLVVLILQNRAAVAASIESAGTAPGAEPAPASGLRRLLAEYWHVVAILYVGIVFIVWLIRPNQGFLFVIRATAVTVLAILIARVAARLVRRGFEAIFRITGDVRQSFPTLEARANRYLQVFNVAAAVIVYGLAALSILNAWGVQSFAWFETPLGQRVGTSVVSILVFTTVAVVAWEVVNALLERYAATAFGPASGRRSARGRTIITLVQRALLIVLGVFVVLVILSEIGINIGPLLAGAGVVGLAVGLGAQTMIKNLIEGMGIILEDSFAVGDIIEIGGKSGVIEAITMRMVRLRDYSGHVHTIPFSQIATITNMTRDFAFAVFDVGVGYDEDIDHVIEVMKAEAAALRTDPKLGSVIREDLEIAGVDALGDSTVVIKARMKIYPPVEQWNVKRAFNRRIKIAFDREGIRIPNPQQKVHIVTTMPDDSSTDAAKSSPASTD